MILRVKEDEMADANVDLKTCGTCGANMRLARFEHRSAIKGDDNWDDVTACTNEKCRDYVRPDWWHNICPHGAAAGKCPVLGCAN